MNGTDDARKLEISDILCIMRTESGRRFVKRVFEYTSFFSDTFDDDPVTHARQAGKRNVGVWLYNELKSSTPDQLQLLMREMIDE